MPADDPGLEFEEDLEEGRPAPPVARSRTAGRGATSGRAGQARGAPGPARAGATRKTGRRRRGLGRRRKGAPPERPRPQVTVRVVGLDRSFQVDEGSDLLRACKDNHVNVFWGPWAQAFNCRGVATCGLCKVQVVEGADHVTPPTKKEAKRLNGKPDDWRLACHARLTGDVRIDPFPRIPVDQQVGEEAIRRALLTDEEREQLRQNVKEQRQAEREKAKGAPAASRERKGLLARLQKRDKDDDATAGKEKGPAAGKKGLLGRAKGKAKGGAEGRAKDKGTGKSKAKGKAKKGDETDAGAEATSDAGAGGSKDVGTKNSEASGKRSFGLKGRK